MERPQKDCLQGHKDETVLSSFQQLFPELLLSGDGVVEKTNVAPALMELESHK